MLSSTVYAGDRLLPYAGNHNRVCHADQYRQELLYDKRDNKPNPDEVMNFVKTVEKYPYDMDVKRGKSIVDAKSLLGLLNLGLNRKIEPAMPTNIARNCSMISGIISAARVLLSKRYPLLSAVVFIVIFIHGVFGKIEADVMHHADVYLTIVAAAIPFVAMYSAGAAIFRAIDLPGSASFF